MKKTILFIAIFSALVVSVASCTTAHHCAAYSQIYKTPANSVIIQSNLVNENI